MSEELYALYDKTILTGYINYLIKNELGFICTNPENFPKLKEEWDYPGLISNAIIESDADSSHDFASILLELEYLGCRFLELRFYDLLTPCKLKELLELISVSKLRSVVLLIRHDEHWTLTEYVSIADQNPRISKILVHGAGKSIQGFHSKLHIIEEEIIDNSGCGVVSSSYFSCNPFLFMEAKLYNTCLNRKISIGVSGEIKNCPSMPSIYGNTKEMKLKEALSNSSFKKFWSINKDQVEICKDCEFRYICTDCRAFISNKDDIFSKPLKCSYNPYLGRWEDSK